jgi:hypothetical protein
LQASRNGHGAELVLDELVARAHRLLKLCAHLAILAPADCVSRHSAAAPGASIPP